MSRKLRASFVSLSALVSLVVAGCPADSIQSNANCADGGACNGTVSTDQNRSCTVKTNADGSQTLSCSDGTSAVITDGANGKNGARGATGAIGPTGLAGGNGANGADGATGAMGSDGENGATGADGVEGTTGATGANGRSAAVAGAGLQIEVQDVTIPIDRHPVVSLVIHDSGGRALDRTGTYTASTISTSFMLSYLTSQAGLVGEYVPYNTASVSGVTVNSTPPALPNATQPRAETNGTWTEVSPGIYTYRFANALPEGYDGTKTHTLAIYASRTLDGAQYAANPMFNFRPDGQPVTETRAIVTTAACNQCHNPLEAHGGSRREVGLCITCHVSGMADPESGNSIEMATLIHKIHSGKTLPSVVAHTPYKIVGYMNAVNDFSAVEFPQSLTNCTTCHQGGADSDRWKTSFSRQACGSCHDDVSFVNPPPSGLTLHSGGVQTTDTLCVNCHAEGMGPIATWDTDVIKVHRIDQQRDLRDSVTGAFQSAAPTLTGTIVGVTGTGPTETPAVTFRVAVNGSAYDILNHALDRIRFTFAGPTTDYVNYSQLTAQAPAGATGTIIAGSQAGEFIWTSPSTMNTLSTGVTPNIPVSGTWAVGIEARLKAKASKANNTQIDVYYMMHNDVFYFPISDATAVPRRTAVVVENCNSCHNDLQAHGGSRNDPEYCVLCHSGNKDSTNIPAPSVGTTKSTTSLRLSHMVHRIHTGENGVSQFQIGANDFSEVLFPGDRRDCTHCHVPAHYALPLPTLLASHTTDIDSSKVRVPSSDHYMGATAAACTGCHDDPSAAVHVQNGSVVSTTDASQIQEACATCHAAGKAYGIDVVHARPGL